MVIQAVAGCNVSIDEAVVSSSHSRGLWHLTVKEQEHKKAAGQHQVKDGGVLWKLPCFKHATLMVQPCEESLRANLAVQSIVTQERSRGFPSAHYLWGKMIDSSHILFLGVFSTGTWLLNQVFTVNSFSPPSFRQICGH